MSGLALFCARWRFAVVGLWFAVLVALVGGVVAAGSGFTDATDLPDGESARAYALLDSPDSTKTENGTIVWRTDGAAVDSPAVRSEVSSWLDKVAATDGVEQVISPYSEQGAAQVNTARSTAYATVKVNDDAATEAIRAQVENLSHDATSAGISYDVGLGGQAFTEQPGASGGTEAIGILVALAILLLMFRSVWAAILPIVTGLVGVGISLLVVMLGSHIVDLSATSITMAALIGLGVGIDYALFIVNRFRNALMSGQSVTGAVTQAVNTSGRAVVFAGLTVAVALLAMFLVGLGILTGMAQAAAVAVVCTVLTAITFLPALLTMLGHRVLSRRQRAALAARTEAGAEEPAAAAVPTVEGHRIARGWAGLVTSRPKTFALAAIGLIALLALPVTSLRVGNADASSDPAGSSGRVYSDLMAPAFGDGIDATLLLIAKTPDPAAHAAFATMVSGLKRTANVAAVGTPPNQGGQAVSVATITPNASAQTEETANLVNHLRDDVIPAAESGTHLEVLVGGETATNIDISQALMSKLPLYLAVVALLGFLLLAVAFRSILVPLVGAISNMATLLVGMGAITAVFQFGWGASLLGVGAAAPVMYIVPVIIVGVMFGLSMDYQVFLVSRMHEEYSHTGDNDRAIKVGLTETAKVIGTAATIMLAIFASFGFSGERIVSAIGIGLAVAVVVDAFVVRMVLVPALMKLIGPRNWAYPRWAERFTPRLAIEADTSNSSSQQDERRADDRVEALSGRP